MREVNFFWISHHLFYIFCLLRFEEEKLLFDSNVILFVDDNEPTIKEVSLPSINFWSKYDLKCDQK